MGWGASSTAFLVSTPTGRRASGLRPHVPGQQLCPYCSEDHRLFNIIPDPVSLLETPKSRILLLQRPDMAIPPCIPSPAAQKLKRKLNLDERQGTAEPPPCWGGTDPAAEAQMCPCVPHLCRGIRRPQITCPLRRPLAHIKFTFQSVCGGIKRLVWLFSLFFYFFPFLSPFAPIENKQGGIVLAQRVMQ